MNTKEQEWPRGYGRVVLDEVDSTMVEAARRAPGLSEPTWIMARHQTAARARRGRQWVSPEGNLSTTLVLPNPGSALQAAQRSFVAANALRIVMWGVVEPDVIGAHAKRTTLKWPNDVLVDGRKIAGILLEAFGAGPDFLAIGIGVNLTQAPPLEAIEPRAVPPIALADVAPVPSADEVLGRLATAFAHEELWYNTGGFEHTRRRWLEHAARLGEVMTARAGETETVGTFVDVDKDGQLVLETPQGRVSIPAADVYF